MMIRPAQAPLPVGQRRVWRVQIAEIDEVLTWLVPRLQETWPKLNEPAMHFWLRSAMVDRMACFCRSQNVVGLALAETTLLDPRPVVNERFVRSKEPANEEAILVYEYIRDWCRSIKACRFTFNLDSDAAMTSYINPALGGKKHSIYIAIPE